MGDRPHSQLWPRKAASTQGPGLQVTQPSEQVGRQQPGQQLGRLISTPPGTRTAGPSGSLSGQHRLQREPGLWEEGLRDDWETLPPG